MKKKNLYFTLVEIMVATAIIGTMILGVIEFMGAQNRYVANNKDKKFALLKANQILNELRTYLEDSGETSGIADTLDRLNNLNPHPLLTIMPLPKSKLDEYQIVLSNNIKMNNETHLSSWKYLRTISIAPIGIGGTRQVTVKIYRGPDFKNFPASNLKDPLSDGYYPKPIISLITVLPTIGDIDFEAQQVFDYYNIAVENIPGWWVHMGDLFPVAQAALEYVDSVNDGMTIRNHWVTRLGYGRDRFYAPYLNIVKDSYQPSENAFYYPGKLPPGFAKPEYYISNLMKCHMQSDLDSPTTAITYINGYNPYFTSELLELNPTQIVTAYNQFNPYPYAPADYLNAPMRYPDMRKYYDLRNYEEQRSWYHKNIDRNPERNPGLLEISREDNPDWVNVEDYFTRVGQGEEMPWALLLDELSMNPDKFRNSIFLNLHGELLPMPPVRNYSDAVMTAGENIQLPNAATGRYEYFRAVAHPERVRYHAKNKSGVVGSTDETDNVDTQNPFLRVYGYLSDPIRSGAWRASGANHADGMSGIKKQRLDDDEEAPITIAIRFQKSTYDPTGDNAEFKAWRELLQSAATTMRNDRYLSFFEGGVLDQNNRTVYYGTNYTSAQWGSFLSGSSIDIPTESNEGWGYLNHSLDSADANAAKTISQDGFRKKGLGVEPLGLPYAPYFYMDYSLDGTKTQWNNFMFFHQRDSSKIHYVSADDANPDTSDIGLNVDYYVGATSSTNSTLVANNILKAAGVFPPVTTIQADIIASGFSIARVTNPAGWTQHFIGVVQDNVLPTTEPAKGVSEWHAWKKSTGAIPSASANGAGYMRFWTGAGYDDSQAVYHSFPRRNYLRGLSFTSTDSQLDEGSLNYWNFALIGPDASNGKYEMLYLKDPSWVPIANNLNYPNSKVAWNDTMNWSLAGTFYQQLDLTKTAGGMSAIMTPMVGTGKFLITNMTDDFTIPTYLVMTTVIPGESSGLPFVPTKGMILEGKRITSVVAELDPSDPAVVLAYKNIGFAGVRYFKVTTSATISTAASNFACSLVIPKAGIGESITVTGTTLDMSSAFYKPAVGMKVYDQTGSNQRTIVSIQSYVEPAFSIGTFASTPMGVMRVTLDAAFPSTPTTVYMVAVPAIYNSAMGNDIRPSAIVNPQKRGLTVYADSKAQLDAYLISIVPGDPNFVKYGVVKNTSATDPFDSSCMVYRVNVVGATASWQQAGVLGRKLSYNSSNSYWNRIPCYDRMWGEIAYTFIHTPVQNKWVPKEILANDKKITGDHCIILTLHNTPMTTPDEATTTANALMTGLSTVNGLSGGLLRNVTPSTFTNDRRLYLLEYIPCAVRTSHKPTGGTAATTTNTLDLLCNDKLAKNTARWRIKVPSRTQLSASVLAQQSLNCVREVGVTSSKSITMSTSTKDYFDTYKGGEQLKKAFLPLTYETRIGGMLVANWQNIAGGDLPIVVGPSPYTDYSGTGAPLAVSAKNGYFINPYKDIADWTMWAKINDVNPLQFDDMRTLNNSRAFVWTVNNIAEYPNLLDDVRIPFSEKFQTYGDPRHMPYMDTKDSFAGTNNGYNWYFASTTSTNNWTDYSNFGKVKNSYVGPNEYDAPKLFMWLREGLVNANAIWCSITGYSYYYLGVGNEIGYDSANGFSNSIPVHMKPWGVNSSSTSYEQSIIDSVIGIKNRSGTWEARHWIGDLIPDTMYAGYVKPDTDVSKTGGALPTGYTSTSDTQFYRFNRENSVYNEIKTLKGIRRIANTGCSAMLNIESSVTAGQKFNHLSQADTNTGAIATNKRDAITDAFKMTFDPNLYSNRPWVITEAANTPTEWTDYAGFRKEGLLVDTKVTPTTVNNLMDLVMYRDSANRIASGILEIHDKGATSDRGKRKKALFLINGLSQMSISGANSISSYSVMSLLYGFLRGGSKRLNPNIMPSSGTLVTKDEEPAFVRELPAINIVAPKITFPLYDPICQIKWTIQWRRWDGKPYWGNNNSSTDPDYWKTEYADPKPTGSIFFRVIFSEAPHSTTNDWRYCQKPDVKTASGLTFDKLIGDNEAYSGSLQDIVEIDGDEVYGGVDNPGREIPVSGTDVSPWAYRLDWKIDPLKLKTAYAFRVECHRRQHTVYYIDGAGVEKAYENNSSAVANAKKERRYMQSHYSFQQGLMIREE